MTVSGFLKWVVTLGLAAGVASAAGCSAGDERLPGTDFGDGVAGPNGDDPNNGDTECEDGDVRDCHVTLDQAGSVVTCLDGYQACEGGRWGECESGVVSERWAPAPPSLGKGESRPLSLGPPAGCINNPCDPFCWGYDEDPPVDIGGVPIVQVPPPGGSLGSLPPGLVNKGLQQPCQTGFDCQFNHYCDDVSTGSTCAHSKCQTGTGLQLGCDRCVDAVCATRPSCCSSPQPHSCAHSPCVTGTKLKSNCSPCVAAICAADWWCCNVNWDALCVARVGINCGWSCPEFGPPGNWDATCVSSVASVCDAKCGPTGTGKCTPWQVGQNDPSCNSWDVAMGVPCETKIPVCNHGTATAPSGLQIGHYPANSNQYPKCAPSTTHPNLQYCSTTQPIPPGQCITVDCPSLNGIREIVINPQGHSGYKAGECSCLDNWTLFQQGTACVTECQGQTQTASFKPVRLFIQLDRSGSMSWGGRWSGTTSALKSFFQDPGSAGIGIALRFWPHDVPT